MIAFLKKVWPGAIVVLCALLAVWYGYSCRPKPTPIPVKQSVVEQAAQHAATAIVAVEHAQTALTQHLVAKVRVVAVRQDTTIPAATRVAIADSILTDDNVRLATELEKTKTALTTDTVVRIPQDSTPAKPLISLPSFGSKLAKGIGQVLTPTIGYGAVYDGHTITTGPSATIGIHLTSGAIGVTAGASAVYAGHAIHLGVGVNVGVRL